MSYTFSRRDFMKYSALTAVAVAGAGMFTGCSNPNQPEGTPGSRLKVIGYHTLQKEITKDGSAYTFTFKHEPNSDIKIDAGCYSIIVGDKEYGATDVNKGTITKFELGDGETKGNLKADDKPATVHLTVAFADNSTVTSAKSIKVRFWPRAYAFGVATDSYNNVYATWNVTSSVQKLNETSTDEGNSSGND